MPTYILYEKGQKVLCPTRYGIEICTVERIYKTASEREIALSMHPQYLILKRKSGEVDPNTISGYFLVPLERDSSLLPFVAIVKTGKSFLYREDIVRLLPAGYSELRNNIESNENSVVVATVQIREGGRVVFYLRISDTTGTVEKFTQEFEKLNPKSKFQNQSDA